MSSTGEGGLKVGADLVIKFPLRDITHPYPFPQLGKGTKYPTKTGHCEWSVTENSTPIYEVETNVVTEGYVRSTNLIIIFIMNEITTSLAPRNDIKKSPSLIKGRGFFLFYLLFASSFSMRFSSSLMRFSCA